MTDVSQSWTVDYWCTDCQTRRPVTVPCGKGAVAFLETKPCCPECGMQTLQLAPEKPLPPGITDPLADQVKDSG